MITELCDCPNCVALRERDMVLRAILAMLCAVPPRTNILLTADQIFQLRGQIAMVLADDLDTAGYLQ